MKTKTFFDILVAISGDNPDVGVILRMKGGSVLQGVLRAPGSYKHDLPEGAVWLSINFEEDLIIDIDSVIGIRRFDQQKDRGT